MFYFGCSQWGYANWKGNIYPSNVKQGDMLYHYGKKFNAVELNPTYHDYVDVLTLKRWSDNVSDSFKFCPKFPKTISHDNKLNNVEDLTKDFIERIGTFDKKLGISFLQLSPDFMPSEIPILDKFLQLLPKGFKISVELRELWMKHNIKLIEALEVIKKNKAGVVFVDDIERSKYLNKFRLTNHSAFIRFIAYGIESDLKRIDMWEKQITVWLEKGLPEVYFFLHFPSEQNDLTILQYSLDKFDKLLKQNESVI